MIDVTRISKFLSKHLRHSPEAIGLTLNEAGWVSVEKLLECSTKAGMYLDRNILDEVVKTNDKKRFSYDETGTLIRANQGHSVEVDLQLKAQTPPSILYHGTVDKFMRGAIEKEGLCKMSRHHVHLSKDKETAIKVGSRRGKPVILEVDSQKMAEDGFEFFLSENGVWLVDSVPAKYIKVL
jgi:putative RNA 2'-phosphotransferase